jgi:hypothetical protein
VLRCGELNQAGILETIAATLVSQRVRSSEGVAAKNLVILRRDRDGWKVALRASRLIQNNAGYVGIEYIDDCSPFWANHIEFGENRPDGRKELVVSLQWRSFENDTDPMPTDIAWDNATGRYREINADGFVPEVKNPPHECPGGASKGNP